MVESETSSMQSARFAIVMGMNQVRKPTGFPSHHDGGVFGMLSDDTFAHSIADLGSKSIKLARNNSLFFGIPNGSPGTKTMPSFSKR